MVSLWLSDLEALEQISQDSLTRELCLRLAALSRTGGLEPFLWELQRDRELDDATKNTLTELADEPSFLLAVEDYVRRTAILH
jgi:hypothetical protein